MKEYFIKAKSMADSKGSFWHRVLIANEDLELIKEKYQVKEIKDSRKKK